MTGSIHLGDPGVDGHHLISISSDHSVRTGMPALGLIRIRMVIMHYGCKRGFE